MNALSEPMQTYVAPPPDATVRTDSSPLYAPVAAPERPLRIGLLLDGTTVPAWVERIVAQIQSSAIARIELVVLNGEPPRVSTTAERIRAKLRHGLYVRWAMRDTARRRDADSAFASRPLDALLQDVPRMTAVPRRRGFVHRIGKADLRRIRDARLDVLLRFGFNILRGDILQAARHGVWSYHHDDSAEYRGGPAMFWEIYEGNPVTGTVLQRLSEELDAGGILDRTHAATHAHSLELNRNGAYWKASSMVMRNLRRLAAEGEVQATPAPPCDKPLYRTPTNVHMAAFLARNTLNKTRDLLEDRLRVPHWFVAWRPATQPVDPSAPRIDGLREVPCPRGHFYADPFLHRHDGRLWLLVEDFIYARNKGNAVAIPWDQDGPAGPAVTMLDLDVHLSYPFIFEWNGDTYLMPESAAARRVSLYRARRFPDVWEHACDLLTGIKAVDATLHEHEGRWYLFANVCETAAASSCDELFLFSAPTPLGPFVPHPANPIVSDVRRARPAGKLFRHQGRLIRPAQDCARSYGNALVFNEVTALTPRHYQERPLGRLAPDWMPGLQGCHTYVLEHGFEIVDGKQPRLRRTVGA